LYYDIPATTYGNPLDMVIYMNSVTGGIAGVLMISIVFVIFFSITMRRYSAEVSFTTASFVSAITTYFFSAMGLVGAHLVPIPSLMFLGSLFLLWRNR
jgi:hypothetical protein